MCGIFGLIANQRSSLTPPELEGAVRRLIRLSEPRGKEASGLAVAKGGALAVYKQAVRPSRMLRKPDFGRFVSHRLTNGDGALPLAVIGHCRLVTNGSQAIPENNQPIQTPKLVGVHNGIVTNDRNLLARYPEINDYYRVDFESDSAVLIGLIQRNYDGGKSLSEAVSATFQELEGSASLAILASDAPVLTLATNTGSLYFATREEEGFFIFASERAIVEKFFNRTTALHNGSPPPVRQLKPLSRLMVPFETLELDEKSFETGAAASPSPSRHPLYRILDESAPQKTLRRCTRCVLPETYPFIRFDEKGVCNYCRKYLKQVPLGREALEEILGRYRSPSGEHDCIVGLSGGRDSSYGLHLLVRELGMHPIAYTYDWALVTDLARRNQAKLCGKLGVEHLIRAADIHTKRRHIRKNIYAWLKKPELGMVPLFMAGDKPFYYYGRQLRKETGLKLTLFSAGHQVEQMDFKAGFCGVDQDLTNNTKLYHFSWWNKARLAGWYAWQYLTNPSYLNESVWDSIFSFYCSFINKDDYVYLYRYMPWDEKVIEKTLREEYDWETDEKYGKNQWRMGDGQTAFTNYIWYRVAGFSEFDTFRSNQIREGMVTREEALKLIEEDNKPRVRMLQDFALLIGFNLEEVLLKINQIPKLY